MSGDQSPPGGIVTPGENDNPPAIDASELPYWETDRIEETAHRPRGAREQRARLEYRVSEQSPGPALCAQRGERGG
jgi:hypothetical protein